MMIRALSHLYVPTLLNVSIACDKIFLLIDLLFLVLASINCTDGLVYRQCGSLCNVNVTCEERDSPSRSCPAICVPGCFCPSDDSVLYNNTCIQFFFFFFFFFFLERMHKRENRVGKEIREKQSRQRNKRKTE